MAKKADGPDAGGTGGQDDDSDAGGKQGGQGVSQEVIDAIVGRERSRAEKQVNDVRVDLQREIDALKSGKPKPSVDGKGTDDDAFKRKVEEARKPLADELEAERTKRTKVEQRIGKAEIKSAAADDSVDPDEVAERLNPFVRVGEDGKTEVVDADGKPRYGAKGPMTVKELVAEYLSKKPYLAKSKTRTGAGYQGAGAQRDTDDLDAQIADAEAKGHRGLAITLKVEKSRRLAGGTVNES